MAIPTATSAAVLSIRSDKQNLDHHRESGYQIEQQATCSSVNSNFVGV